MRYRLQVFIPATNKFSDTHHISPDLAVLRRIASSSAFGSTGTRIVDETGTPIPDPARNRRPLTLTDFAKIMKPPAKE